MQRVKRVGVAVIVIGLVLSGSAKATLVDVGGGMIYDDALNITWLQDANYAGSSGYSTGAGGRMNWTDAMNWADHLSYGGSDSWRLPYSMQPDSNCSDFNSRFPFDSEGVGCTGSELVHLANDLAKAPRNPFKNFRLSFYWTLTPYAYSPFDFAWVDSPDGLQTPTWKTDKWYAWAVHDGRIDLPVSAILPKAKKGASFLFDFSVLPDKSYFIDPAIAVGYDYATGAGDPNFRSVTLPVGVGDGKYDIWDCDSAGNLVLVAHNQVGGHAFDFGSGGVSCFRVTGIEPSAGLDPDSPTAFVTELTFTGTGTFEGTQTPIVEDSVPEPASLSLIGLALAGLGWSRKQKMQ